MKGDVALKEHKRWSRYCDFGKGLCVGNFPILSNGQPQKLPPQRSRSRDVCGPHLDLKPN